MDIHALIHNQLIINSSIGLALLLIGWALPDKKLYAILKPPFEFLKVRFGKPLVKFIGQKLGVAEKVAEDVVNEPDKK